MTANGKKSWSVISGLCLLVGLGAVAMVVRWIIGQLADGAVDFGLAVVLVVLTILLGARVFVAIRWGGMSTIIAGVLAFVALVVGSYFGLLCTSMLGSYFGS